MVVSAGFEGAGPAGRTLTAALLDAARAVDLGLEVPGLAPETLERRDKALPPHGSHGTRLMRRLMEIAARRGLSAMEGAVLAENTGMLRRMRDLGFSTRPSPEDPDIQGVSHTL